MKKVMLLPLTIVFALQMTACQKDGDALSDPQRSSIVILYENDVHCAVDGYAAMAGLRDAIADTAYTGLVSCGDFLHGSLVGTISNGGYIVDIMRSMRYDAVGLGNHEFVYGVPRLLELMSGFNAPVLCANLFAMQGDRLFASYTLRRYGNRRVAFVGVVTSWALEAESYAFFSNGTQHYDLRPAQVAQLVQQAVDEARGAGADYVVLLSHLGELPVEGHYNSHELVAATSGIDIVLDGHSHSVVGCDTVLNRSGQPVYISQTGTQFANVGKLVIDKEGGFHFELIPTHDIPYHSTDVSRTVDSVQALVSSATGSVVFHSDYLLTINDADGNRLVRKGETNAGDIVADAIRHITGAQIGINNGGGIRTDIEPGDVTLGQVVNMLPFDNHIVTIEASGAQILTMLQLCTARLPQEDGEFPQVSGLRFTIRTADHTIVGAEVLQADGSYALLDPAANYTIGTTDYCAYNGGLYNAFADCRVLQTSLTLYRETLVPYVNEVYGGTVPSQYATSQGRIAIE